MEKYQSIVFSMAIMQVSEAIYDIDLTEALREWGNQIWAILNLYSKKLSVLKLNLDTRSSEWLW